MFKTKQLKLLKTQTQKKITVMVENSPYGSKS